MVLVVNSWSTHTNSFPQAAIYVLIHYLGNETATCEFALGNSKHHSDRQYTRTCPSVLQSVENECTLSTTAKVYRKNITNQTPTSHLPVLKARNSQQVENILNKKLKEQRLSHDSLYNLHGIALDMPEFVQDRNLPRYAMCMWTQSNPRWIWYGPPSAHSLSICMIECQDLM